MTEKEFAFLLSIDQPAADAELEKLNHQGLIQKVSVKEVAYWQAV
jgi:hypothetical protein